MAFPTLDEVVAQLRTIAENDAIGPETKFASLEIDSLDILEWVFEIEEQAKVTLDESLYGAEALETATVGDLYQRIQAAQPG
jgi:acyl carrier protein